MKIADYSRFAMYSLESSPFKGQLWLEYELMNYMNYMKIKTWNSSVLETNENAVSLRSKLFLILQVYAND